MAVKWHKLLLQLFILFILEIILNLLGFDDRADYSEFILENKKIYIHQIGDLNYALTSPKAFNKIISNQIYSFPF